MAEQATQHALFATIQSATPIDGVAPAPAPPAPPPSALNVKFSTGEFATLIPNAPPHARLLVERFKGSTRPLWAATHQGAIIALRLPLIGRVVRFDVLPDDTVEAALDASSRVLVLPAGNSGPREVLHAASLNRHVVAVAPDSAGLVVDAAFAPQFAAKAPLFGQTGAEPLATLKVALEPELALPALFTAMTDLAFSAAKPDGIFPFDYPDEGCESRAHEMCRLLAAAGTTLGKVWVFNLPRTDTANHLLCYARWNWHVASFLRVKGVADPQASVRVLDPSLHSGFVTLDAFLSGLGRTIADARFSAARYFQVGFDGRGSLENPNQAQDYLVDYREAARKRVPQPPYPWCPTP